MSDLRYDTFKMEIRFNYNFQARYLSLIHSIPSTVFIRARNDGCIRNKRSGFLNKHDKSSQNRLFSFQARSDTNNYELDD